ncbi:MAG: hypothetical protein ACK5M4_15945 [Pseudorhodobacter sp.]
MTKYLIAAALSATTFGALPALAIQPGLTSGVRAQVQELLPNADLSALSPSQEARITNIVAHGPNEYSNDLDRRNVISNILNER